MGESDALSRSTEDYLKTIYRLESESGAAQTSAIAEALEIAPPSVSGMVKRLSESGFLDHVPYRGVQLTAAGRRAALRMVRRHRILESYLIEKLDYDWDTVHDEAERLGGAVGADLAREPRDGGQPVGGGHPQRARELRPPLMIVRGAATELGFESEEIRVGTVIGVETIGRDPAIWRTRSNTASAAAAKESSDARPLLPP